MNLNDFDTLEIIEYAMDEIGVGGVIEAMKEICLVKADHSDDQDEAKRLERDGKLLARIESYFQKGGAA